MREQTTHAKAAAMLRSELAQHGIPARVRSRTASMMNAVDVYVKDQPPWVRKALEARVRDFQYGSFDGMTDSYEYDNERSDLPQVKYAHLNCEFSPELKQRAWDYVRGWHVGFDGAPASASDAHGFYNENMRCWGSDAIWRVLNGSLGSFWQKPRKRLTVAQVLEAQSC